VILTLSVLIVVLQVPVTPVPAHEPEPAPLPPGEGRDAVVSMCTPCHGVGVVASVRKTPLAWDATVETMRGKGAKGSDEQAHAAAEYLAKALPAVDVNTATVEEIATIAGLTPEEAAAIVAYREDGHTITSYTALKKVPGLDPKHLAAAKAKIAYAPK
jgi:competence protein ComEA